MMTISESQYSSNKMSSVHKVNDRVVHKDSFDDVKSSSSVNSALVTKRGFKPSDMFDPHKKEFLTNLSYKLFPVSWIEGDNSGSVMPSLKRTPNGEAENNDGPLQTPTDCPVFTERVEIHEFSAQQQKRIAMLLTNLLQDLVEIGTAVVGSDLTLKLIIDTVGRLEEEFCIARQHINKMKEDVKQMMQSSLGVSVTEASLKEGEIQPKIEMSEEFETKNNGEVSIVETPPESLTKNDTMEIVEISSDPIANEQIPNNAATSLGSLSLSEKEDAGDNSKSESDNTILALDATKVPAVSDEVRPPSPPPFPNNGEVCWRKVQAPKPRETENVTKPETAEEVDVVPSTEVQPEKEEKDVATTTMPPELPVNIEEVNQKQDDEADKSGPPEKIYFPRVESQLRVPLPWEIFPEKYYEADTLPPWETPKMELIDNNEPETEAEVKDNENETAAETPANDGEISGSTLLPPQPPKLEEMENKPIIVGDKEVDLNKIFTPASDAEEHIIKKDRKFEKTFASSAFYVPGVHPTVKEQMDLARTISKSLSDSSNNMSKGQSMYVNRKKRSVKWVHEGRGRNTSNLCSTPSPVANHDTPYRPPSSLRNQKTYPKPALKHSPNLPKMQAYPIQSPTISVQNVDVPLHMAPTKLNDVYASPISPRLPLVSGPNFNVAPRGWGDMKEYYRPVSLDGIGQVAVACTDF